MTVMVFVSQGFFNGLTCAFRDVQEDRIVLDKNKLISFGV
jgi:hypothetical protein